MSVRIIYRDIDVISSAGISIYATQSKGGGIEIADDFRYFKLSRIKEVEVCRNSFEDDFDSIV